MEELGRKLGKNIDYTLSWTYHFLALVSILIFILLLCTPKERNYAPLAFMSFCGHIKVVAMNNGKRDK